MAAAQTVGEIGKVIIGEEIHFQRAFFKGADNLDLPTQSHGKCNFHFIEVVVTLGRSLFGGGILAFFLFDLLFDIADGHFFLDSLTGNSDHRVLVMQSQKGADIKAGINLAEEINVRATTPEEMRDLRDMYRSEVVGFTKPQDCFRSLVAARGAGGLKDAIAFLIAGCGRDLASADPSMEHAALGRILTDLQCVQVLQTVMEKLSQLGARMGEQFAEPCLLDGEQLTGRVVELTEQSFVTSVAVARLVGECGMAKLLAQMDFTRELTRVFRQLSPRLFAKEGDRQRLVDAAQDHLDALITRENEEEEASA